MAATAATAASAASTATTAAGTFVVTTTTATAGLALDAVVLDLTDLKELGGNLVREVQGPAIVEVDAFVIGFACVDDDDRVVLGRAAAGLTGLLLGAGEVQERAASAAESVLFRAICVAASNADEELVGRLGRLAWIDREGVAVEGANLVAVDFVAGTVAGLNGI